MNDRHQESEEMDDEMLTKLISLADQGPPIPRDEMENARALLRSAWITTVRHRRRRRTLRVVSALAAVLVVAVVLSMFLNTPQSTSPTIVAQVAAIDGIVWIETPSGNRVRLTAGAELQDGGTLVTDHSSRAAILLRSGHRARIDRDSTLTLLADQRIDLSEGAIYVDSGVIHSSGIRIVTPLGEATDIGTRFEVRYRTNRLGVLVRSGTVRVNLTNQELQVGDGRGLVVPASGDPEWIPVARWGAEWDWTRAITPPFEIEGRTVNAFLKWYERETGREVRFSDAHTERLAKQTTLHGPTVEVAPELAAEGVLASAGLEGELKNGEITIRSIQPGADLAEGN